MNMPACTLFNEQNKIPSLLSIITCSVLGKQNVRAEKVYFSGKIMFQTQTGCSFVYVVWHDSPFQEWINLFLQITMKTKTFIT